MKFWKNFAILAVAAWRLCETHRKRARVFKTLLCIVLPSFTSNDTPSRSMASVPGFRHFRAGPRTSKFSSFAVFFACLTSHYSRIRSRVGFLMEKCLLRENAVERQTRSLYTADAHTRSTQQRTALRMSLCCHSVVLYTYGV